MCSHKLVGSQRWHDEIGKALRRCHWFAVVLSPASVRSRWVKQELLYALNAEQYEERIVPIFYKSCDYARLSWTLDNIQRVDFRRDFARGCADLAKVWRPRRSPRKRR